MGELDRSRAARRDHIFASVGAGFSLGREAGATTETGAHYHQLAAFPEMYFRLGFAFE